MHFYDAHNHLQDERLLAQLDDVLAACASEGVRRMVVNGSCEEDWPRVLELARRHPVVLPAFGYHPWYVRERTSGWLDLLRTFLDAMPSAVGEIGLDRWIENPDLEGQEEMFRAQLRLAAGRNLPATIHCLKAWGWLDQILREEPLPARGFLLHSYGGPAEMVDGFVKLGAYFSLSGYFAHERKARQREVFGRVPPERLLIETDAPEMWPPDGWNRHPMTDSETGEPMNHPANLGAVYDFAAGLLGISREMLAEQVEQNFQRLFGGLVPEPTAAG
ncbi:MAG TPA: TatD family deoxyribonuclease [Verrucomicrobiales bacterium]|nr:TatD family deoxyribonuclease [Verrucomicrobiales bacterium]